jgi:hypothetical protein
VTEAELKKIINSEAVKFNEEELKLVIQTLKRLAEIEHLYHSKKSNEKSNYLL